MRCNPQANTHKPKLHVFGKLTVNEMSLQVTTDK